MVAGRQHCVFVDLSLCDLDRWTLDHMTNKKVHEDVLTVLCTVHQVAQLGPQEEAVEVHVVPGNISEVNSEVTKRKHIRGQLRGHKEKTCHRSTQRSQRENISGVNSGVTKRKHVTGQLRGHKEKTYQGSTQGSQRENMSQVNSEVTKRKHIRGQLRGHKEKTYGVNSGVTKRKHIRGQLRGHKEKTYQGSTERSQRENMSGVNSGVTKRKHVRGQLRGHKEKTCHRSIQRSQRENISGVNSEVRKRKHIRGQLRGHKEKTSEINLEPKSETFQMSTSRSGRENIREVNTEGFIDFNEFVGRLASVILILHYITSIFKKNFCLPVEEGCAGKDHGVIIGPFGRITPAPTALIPEVATTRVAHNTVSEVLPHREGKIHLE